MEFVPEKIQGKEFSKVKIDDIVNFEIIFFILFFKFGTRGFELGIIVLFKEGGTGLKIQGGCCETFVKVCSLFQLIKCRHAPFFTL